MVEPSVDPVDQAVGEEEEDRELEDVPRPAEDG